MIQSIFTFKSPEDAVVQGDGGVVGHELEQFDSRQVAGDFDGATLRLREERRHGDHGAGDRLFGEGGSRLLSFGQNHGHQFFGAGG